MSNAPVQASGPDPAKPQAAKGAFGLPARLELAVKIIGARPRSENCAEQVWPYIEPRCLTRVHAARPASPASDAAAARSTTGAAPSLSARS